MTIRILLLALVVLCAAALPAQATETKRAKKRAKDRVENRKNNEIDKSVDKAVDDVIDGLGSLFGKKKKKDSGANEDPATASDDDELSDEEAEAQRSVLGALGLGGDWEPYTNPRSFSLVMEVTEIKKNGKEQTSVMKLAALPEQSAMHFLEGGDGKQEQARMILNTQTGKTTMVTTDKGETTAMRMRMPNMKKLAREVREDVLDPERFRIEETDERRTIQGYDCRKYIVTDLEEGYVTESWITRDLDLTAMEIYSGIGGMFGGANMQSGTSSGMKAPYEGMPIESVTTDEKGRVYKQQFRDIRIGEEEMDRSLFDLDGIEVQEIGF